MRRANPKNAPAAFSRAASKAEPPAISVILQRVIGGFIFGVGLYFFVLAISDVNQEKHLVSTNYNKLVVNHDAMFRLLFQLLAGGTTMIVGMLLQLVAAVRGRR